MDIQYVDSSGLLSMDNRNFSAKKGRLWEGRVLSFQLAEIVEDIDTLETSFHRDVLSSSHDQNLSCKRIKIQDRVEDIVDSFKTHIICDDIGRRIHLYCDQEARDQGMLEARNQDLDELTLPFFSQYMRKNDFCSLCPSTECASAKYDSTTSHPAGTHIPSTLFAYEITFHTHQTPVGLELRPHHVHYASGEQSLSCCVVVSASSVLQPAVQVGDLVVRMNDSILVGVSEAFSFESVTSLIAMSSTPRTIRFLSISMAVGMGKASHTRKVPSPAELMMLAGADPAMVPNVVSAKYNYVSVDSPIGSYPSLQLTYMDSQIAQYIKNRIPGSGIVDVSTLSSPSVSAQKGGIYRDRIHNKWIAVVVVVFGDAEARVLKQYTVGRFDNEEEASRHFLRAQEDVRRFGSFSMKRLLRQNESINRPRKITPG